jgi:phosphopantothenoylcysteine decarboxylase/phosphopantothenate--cysteine ligase
LARAEHYWLDGKRVVVTGGGTREPIDPVRYIGNRSSGKMGNELALAAANVGAGVTLITAAEPTPSLEGIEVVDVDTAAEMHAALLEWLPGARILIMAAAVADYRPARVSPMKIKKSGGALTLELEPTEDILASLRQSGLRDGVFVVGFAAETQDLVQNALTKMHAKDLDLIVVNDVGRDDIAMNSDFNEVTVIDETGVIDEIPRAPKHDIAAAILRDIHLKLQ